MAGAIYLSNERKLKMRNFRSAAVAAAFMSAVATVPVQAANILMEVHAGQSIDVGAVNPPYAPTTADGQVCYVYELGQADDAQYDITTAEVPPSTTPNAPRFLQDVPMACTSLAPVTVAGVSRGGPEIAHGRLIWGAYGAGATIVEAKYAFGGSSLNRHWENALGAGLSTRMLEWITKLAIQLEDGGVNTVRIASFNWVQGPSDMAQVADSDSYFENLTRLVARVRALPWASAATAVVISRTNVDISKLPASVQAAYTRGLPIVRKAQEDVVANDNCAFLTTEDDLPHEADGFHYPYLNATNFIGQRQYSARTIIAGRAGCTPAFAPRKLGSPPRKH